MFDSGDTLTITPDTGGEFELVRVDWNYDADLIQDHYDDPHGPHYGEPYNYEFIEGYIGALRIDRDMLVKILSETEVQSIEENK